MVVIILKKLIIKGYYNIKHNQKINIMKKILLTIIITSIFSLCSVQAASLETSRLIFPLTIASMALSIQQIQPLLHKVPILITRGQIIDWYKTQNCKTQKKISLCFFNQSQRVQLWLQNLDENIVIPLPSDPRMKSIEEAYPILFSKNNTPIDITRPYMRPFKRAFRTLFGSTAKSSVNNRIHQLKMQKQTMKKHPHIHTIYTDIIPTTTIAKELITDDTVTEEHSPALISPINNRNNNNTTPTTTIAKKLITDTTVTEEHKPTTINPISNPTNHGVSNAASTDAALGSLIILSGKTLSSKDKNQNEKPKQNRLPLKKNSKKIKPC